MTKDIPEGLLVMIHQGMEQFRMDENAHRRRGGYVSVWISSDQTYHPVSKIQLTVDTVCITGAKAVANAGAKAAANAGAKAAANAGANQAGAAISVNACQAIISINPSMNSIRACCAVRAAWYTAPAPISSLVAIPTSETG